jgi:GxxExxY protein
LTYQGYYVGEGFADLLVGSGAARIAVELKAVAQSMGRHEEQQLRNYMKVLKVKHGLLINFQHLSSSKAPKTATELQIRNVSL